MHLVSSLGFNKKLISVVPTRHFNLVTLICVSIALLLFLCMASCNVVTLHSPRKSRIVGWLLLLIWNFLIEDMNTNPCQWVSFKLKSNEVRPIEGTYWERISGVSRPNQLFYHGNASTRLKLMANLDRFMYNKLITPLPVQDVNTNTVILSYMLGWWSVLQTTVRMHDGPKPA